MKFKITDKIMTKKEILLYPEGYNQYFIIRQGKKVFNIAKEVNIGDLIDCSSEKEDNNFELTENFKIIKPKKS